MGRNYHRKLSASIYQHAENVYKKINVYIINSYHFHQVRELPSI